jgi:hypothetical protein
VITQETIRGASVTKTLTRSNYFISRNTYAIGLGITVDFVYILDVLSLI